MCDSDEDATSATQFRLTSILFGNIDERGQLEDDVFDSESKRHLASLARLGLSSILNELIEGEEVTKSETTSEDNYTDLNPNFHSDDDFAIKSPSAIDYFDITELAEDNGGLYQNDSVMLNKQVEDNTDYDADDEEPASKSDTQLMPPPPLPDTEKSGNNEYDSEGRKKKLETPLAAMLPSKYADVDVRELFPDFRVDKVRNQYQFTNIDLKR